jgi:hypothetical protein
MNRPSPPSFRDPREGKPMSDTVGWKFAKKESSDRAFSAMRTLVCVAISMQPSSACLTCLLITPKDETDQDNR